MEMEVDEEMIIPVTRLIVVIEKINVIVVLRSGHGQRKSRTCIKDMA